MQDRRCDSKSSRDFRSPDYMLISKLAETSKVFPSLSWAFQVDPDFVPLWTQKQPPKRAQKRKE